MLTKTDLEAIKTVVRKEVKQVIQNDLKQQIKPIKEDVEK